MKKRLRKFKKESKIIELINKHIESNFGLYFLFGILFFISIAIGVLFVNSLSSAQSETLQLSITNRIHNIANNNNNYLKEIIKENSILFFTMWFSGITIIGIIINYIMVIYKGFCLGYTISAIAISIGKGKAILFVLSSMLIQNIIFLPALFAVAVSSMRFLKMVLKERNKETVFLEIIRHTIISGLMWFVAICSGCMEIFVSNEILKIILRYI